MSRTAIDIDDPILKEIFESVMSITQPDGTTVANKDMSEEWADFLTGLAVGIAILYNW